MSADKRESSKPQWRLPVLQGLLRFDKSRLGADIMAGITLATKLTVSLRFFFISRLGRV